MRVGELVKATDVTGNELLRVIVAIDDEIVHICTREEMERATNENRVPVTVGFPMKYVVKADKGQFDEVLSRMLAKPPQKTADIHGWKKGQVRKPKPSRKSARSK